MAYESPSDYAKIAQLEDEQNNIRDILFFESVHGVSQSSPYGQGRKLADAGPELGPKSWVPIERSVTEVDEAEVSTGVFDKLDLHALATVVDAAVSTIPLKFIQHISDGKIFSLTPKAGKILELLPGGNIAVSAATQIADTAAGLFQYFADTDTVKCIALGGGGPGGILPPGTAANDHLQWNGSAWIAQQTLDFDNSSIALSWANVAADGFLELKVDSSDFFDFTDSSNGPVAIKIRAQDAVEADAIFTIIKSGFGDIKTTFNDGVKLNFDVGATHVFDATIGGIAMGTNLDIDMNGGVVGDISSLLYELFGTDGKAITRFVTGSGGIQYDLENAGASHVFRVSGNPPAEVFRINNNQIVASQDFNFQGNLLLGTERADPTTPAANTGVYYIKDVSTVSTPFFMGDDGIAIDLTVGSGANTALSNLVNPTLINQDLQPDTTDIRDLGDFSFYWDNTFTRRVSFKDNKAPVAAESGIGSDASKLWINQTIADNLISLRWDDVESFSFARTTGLVIRNPALVLSIIGATDTHSITNLASGMQFLNNASIANRHFTFGDSGTPGERIHLYGTGGVNTEFRFRTDEATAVTDIAAIKWEGHNASAADHDYAEIVGQVVDPTLNVEDGALFFRVLFGGTENTTFLTLNLAASGNIGASVPLDMNNNKIIDIGETTITDLTTVTGASGDFAMIVDATDGLMKKVDLVDLLGGGGGLPHLDGNGATTIIENTTDTSKDLRFNLSSLTASAVKTITWVGGGTSTYTFQSVGGLIAQLDTAQTWSAAQTFQDNHLLIQNPAATFEYTITGQAILADRILNLPLTTGTDTLAALGVAQTWTANNLAEGTWTFTSATNGILMSSGSKIEFESGGAVNLELQATTTERDPDNLGISTEGGLVVDINDAGDVFRVGDGSADPWMLIDEDALHFGGTPATAANGHNVWFTNLAALHTPGSGDIVNIKGRARVSAADSSYTEFGRINISAEVMSTTDNLNEGGVRLQATSNSGFRTGIRVLGVGAGVSNAEVGFYNNSADHSTQQTVSGVLTTDNLAQTQTKIIALQDALDAVGLVLKS